MITWLEEIEPVAVLSLLCVQSVEKQFVLSLELSEDLSNCFLYTISDFLGIVTAKRSDQLTYLPVQAYSLTPSCYLGSLAIGTYEIDIKLNFSSNLGEQIIPIGLGYGDDVLDMGQETFSGNVASQDFPWYSDEGMIYFGS